MTARGAPAGEGSRTGTVGSALACDCGHSPQSHDDLGCHAWAHRRVAVPVSRALCECASYGITMDARPDVDPWEDPSTGASDGDGGRP